MRNRDSNKDQLSFDALLTDAGAANRQRQREKRYAHLPDTMAAALPYFRGLLAEHHAFMCEGNSARVTECRRRAHDLAVRLNGYEPGILADDTAPGSVLARLTRAPDGTVPLWGQTGSFEIQYKSMRERIELDGVFGICATSMAWVGFSAHAIEQDKPFLSDTGYRRFLGGGGPLLAGYTPDRFAAEMIAAHVERNLCGRLEAIRPLRTLGGTVLD